MGHPVVMLILLVEDNLADVRLFREVLKDLNARANVQVVRDGVEAMAYLRREGPYEGAARPDLVILDLNLPRKDGRQVLAEVKGDPVLTEVPIVILTSSKRSEDVKAAYRDHANCYVRKPLDFVQFQTAVGEIEKFWLGVVELPSA